MSLVIFPRQAVLMAEQDPLDLAAQRIHEAGTDFLCEAFLADSALEVERAQKLLGTLIVELMAVQDSVGDRLNKLQARR